MSELVIPGGPASIPAGYRTQTLTGGFPSLTLASDVADADILEFTGTLTAQDIRVIIPTPLLPQQVTGSYSGPTAPSWMKIIKNSTSGLFNVVLQCAGGSSTLTIPQGETVWVYSPDGLQLFEGSAPAGAPVPPPPPVTGPPDTMAFFDGTGTLAGNPTFVTVDPVLGAIYVGATTSDHGSSSHFQVSSITANAAQFRSNQYGANAGAPGISTFKSRGATVGSLGGILAGDILFRATCVGVAPDNVSIPLAGFITIQVPLTFTPAGQSFAPSEYELQLVPLAGPINSRRVVFKVSSEGETQTLSGVRAGGPNTLPANLTTGTLWSSGNVQPNGAIIGSPGDLYSFTGGGAGTTLWVKETGIASNVGWVGK